MKKLFLLGAFAIISALGSMTYAYDDNYYYGKITVGVAEDSKGLGTVYMLENDEKVMEIEDRSLDYMGMNGGANIGARIFNEPAEGYVLANFTDQNNQTYKYEVDEDGETDYMVLLFATSKDEADPTIFNLLAHFVKADDLPKDILAEAVVAADEKYGTFMAPVAARIPDDMKAYRVTGIDGTTVVLEGVESELLDAFTPVLLENLGLFDATIKATYSQVDLPEELPSFTSGLLTGVLEEELLPEGVYTLEADGEGSSRFEKVTDDETFIDPYRCYLTVPESTEEVYTIGEKKDGPGQGAVKTLLNDLQEGNIYDLQGRKLERLQKGLNIVGNVKIIVK